MRLPPELPELPVTAALDAIVGSLAERGAGVLVAPPGSGKTTLVLPRRCVAQVLDREPRQACKLAERPGVRGRACNSTQSQFRQPQRACEGFAELNERWV